MSISLRSLSFVSLSLVRCHALFRDEDKAFCTFNSWNYSYYFFFLFKSYFFIFFFLFQHIPDHLYQSAITSLLSKKVRCSGSHVYPIWEIVLFFFLFYFCFSFEFSTFYVDRVLNSVKNKERIRVRDVRGRGGSSRLRIYRFTYIYTYI